MSVLIFNLMSCLLLKAGCISDRLYCSLVCCWLGMVYTAAVSVAATSNNWSQLSRWMWQSVDHGSQVCESTVSVTYLPLLPSSLGSMDNSVCLCLCDGRIDYCCPSLWCAGWTPSLQCL